MSTTCESRKCNSLVLPWDTVPILVFTELIALKWTLPATFLSQAVLKANITQDVSQNRNLSQLHAITMQTTNT